MSTSWFTSQHLLYAVPVAIVIGLLLFKMLIRLVVIVVVVVGVGVLVLGPTGAHLPPDVQRTVRGVVHPAMQLWETVRGLGS